MARESFDSAGATARVASLIERQIASLAQRELAELIRALCVPLRWERRFWNYGEPEQVFFCCVFAEHQASGVSFVYCENGFGPDYPWGMLSAAADDRSMGLDGQWYASIEDVFRGSGVWRGVDPPGYEVD